MTAKYYSIPVTEYNINLIPSEEIHIFAPQEVDYTLSLKVLYSVNPSFLFPIRREDDVI